MKIGILAVQGAVEPHEKMLKKLGVETRLVRREEDLVDLSGIILPGGESTTMIRVLKLNNLWNPLRKFAETKPTWGICAGVILLAKRVSAPQQESLELLDVNVERNAYGRQLESFIAPLERTSEAPTSWDRFEGVFIRAPKISTTKISAHVLLTYKGDPVLIEENNLLASTFHPELTDSPLIHEYFIKKSSQHDI